MLHAALSRLRHWRKGLHAPGHRSLAAAAALVGAAAALAGLHLGQHQRLQSSAVSSGEASEAEGHTPLQARHLALVINAADPLSEAIGQHYQRARRIPQAQVIRVRFPPGPALPEATFHRIHAQVRRLTPAHVQAYALAWAAPWRVGCVSITSAFSFGRLRSGCSRTCATTPANPWYARGDIEHPWSRLGLRPSMLLAATSPEAGRALIDRGVAADGSAPPGTAYLLSSSDRLRNGRAGVFPYTRRLLAGRLQIRILQTDALPRAGDVIALFTGLASLPDLNSLSDLNGLPDPNGLPDLNGLPDPNSLPDLNSLPDPGRLRFRPGAVADHLTSYGGVLTGPSGRSADGGNGQMSALRWLEAGATGSYGTVVEPCNLTSKFPHPGLLLTYYRRGDTLLESYWRSVAMPEQGVFIGEPLARPWPARPQQL